MPRYSGWGQNKPPLGTQIDRGHPLAKGLVGCFTMNEGGGLSACDIARKTVGVMSGGAVFIPSRQGRGIKFTGATPSGISLSIPRLSGDYSVTLGIIPSEVTGEEYDLYYDWSSAQRNCLMRIASSKLELLNGNGASSQDATLVSNTTLVVNNYYMATFRRLGSVFSLYVNGLYDNLKSGSYSGGLTTNVLYLGRCPLGLASFGYTGTMLFAYIHQRCITPKEINWLYTEPYCFLQPVVRRSYSIPVAARSFGYIIA